VRFTVTALGSAGDKPVPVVVGSITRYLIAPNEPTGTSATEPTGVSGSSGDSVSRYYADRGDSPGRWLGVGASDLGLVGEVDPEAFTGVLAGRHPCTGERLITARGSAGRVASVGAGTAARRGPNGESLYAVRDVATVLGWSQADVREAIVEGERYAAARLVAGLAGVAIPTGTATPGHAAGSRRATGAAPSTGTRHLAATGRATRDRSGYRDEESTRPGPPARGGQGGAAETGTPGSHPGPGRSDSGMVLVPSIDRDGTRYVGERELTRVEDLVSRGLSGKEVLDPGDPGEELSVAAASRLVGTSPSYLARLCRTYETSREGIDAALAVREMPRRAYLVCRRAEDGTYRVTRQELAAFAERRRRPAVRVGYDVTATTEKSISVLALLGGRQVRGEVLAAVEAANDAGIGWLEYNAAAARAGGQVVGVTGWTVASFQHLTSRRLDPFVHHHNVVANTVVDEHGDRRALDARRLYRNVSAASAIATAQVRFELTRRLGVAWRPARQGGWEVAGISDTVLDEFSQRRREITDAIRELEDALGRASTLDEFQSAVSKTRPAKTDAAEAELLVAWWQRAYAHGLTPTGLHQTLGHARPTLLTRALRARILAAAATAVTAERSIFTRGDLLATLVDLPHPDGHGPLVVPAATLEQLADELLGSTRVVQLERTTGDQDKLQRADGTTLAVGGDHEPEYTTTDVLVIQTRILDTYAAGVGVGAGNVDSDTLATTLGRFPELSREQRQLVASFCTSGDSAQSAIGRPGTGKTHAMRAAVTAWTNTGCRVLGAAVKAEAARHLGAECGIPAEPLAWYLNRLGDPYHSPLDHRTVLVVDEASTVGDRALDQLLTAANRTGATVRFIGDPAQHGSVPTGGMWHLLLAHHPDRTPELVASRRVRHFADRAAAEALRTGEIAVALDALEAAGHLHVLDDERQLYVALLDRWWTARRAGRLHPMVDRRNDQRLVLNQLARALRRHAGELGDTEVHATGGRRFAIGDEVIARMGDRSLHAAGQPQRYVRNGAHGTVVAVQRALARAEDHITVAFHGLGDIDLPRAFFDEHRDLWGRLDVGLDHAYAITSYAVEGLTFDESTSHVDPRSSRPEVYVDITRGRHANHLYLTAPEDHIEGERLPAAPTEPDRTKLERRLTHSGPERVAIAVDPLAAPAAAYAEGKTLAQLTQERLATLDSAQGALIARAERLREHQIRRLAQARPDPSIVRRLGSRPVDVNLARRYDSQLSDAVVQRARREAYVSVVPTGVNSEAETCEVAM
jgi:conjugative relaxase-like TrwC/TraI family protein